MTTVTFRHSGHVPHLRPQQMPPRQFAAATATLSTGKVVLTFGAPVIVQSVPASVTVQGIAPTAYTQDSPTQVTLTYAAPVVTGNVLNWPANVAEVRTRDGGYIAAFTHTF